MAKILILEDDKIVRSALKVVMINEGFETYYTDDGMEALEIAVQNRPDIVLCDISMPKMSGYEFFKLLRSKPETSHIPVIFLTALVSDEEVQLGLEMGVNAYLKKPMRPVEIIDTIRKNLPTPVG